MKTLEQRLERLEKQSPPGHITMRLVWADGTVVAEFLTLWPGVPPARIRLVWPEDERGKNFTSCPEPIS